MAQVLNFPIGRDSLYATLSRCERDFVETLLHLFPNYSYDLSGLPKLNPPPAPGVASAVAAAKTIIALIREGGFDIAQIAVEHRETAH